MASTNINILPLETPSSITLHKLIGSGTYGNVYQGSFIDPRDNTLYKDVAIKYINTKDMSESTVNLQRNEIRLAQSLKSGAVVKVIAQIEHNDDLFIIMERLSENGLALSRKAEQMRQDENWNGLAYMITRQFIHLLKGLQDMHKSCILHRDIKPQNLLIDDITGLAKFTDFGMACFYKECKGLVGTLNYLEPQCYLKSKFNIGRCKIDEWSDIYSLGMTMYTILTGKQLIGKDDISPTSEEEYIAYLKRATKTLIELSKKPGMHKLTLCISYMTSPNPNKRPSPEQVLEVLQTTNRDIIKSAFKNRREYIHCDK